MDGHRITALVSPPLYYRLHPAEHRCFWRVGQCTGLYFKHSLPLGRTVSLFQLEVNLANLDRPVYEGANFVILGRILYYIPYLSPIHPGRVFSTFVGLLFLVELLTANGAALLANTEATETNRDVGEGLLKAALVLQLAVMVGFVSLAVTFHVRCWRAALLTKKLRSVLIVLYCSCALITTRTVFRTVEYFMAAGQHRWDDPEDADPIVKNEWIFWIFEVAIMFANTMMLNIFHPMMCLPRSNKIYLAKDGVTEVEGPGFKDPRPWYVTFIDPFDIAGLIFKKGKDYKYWEAEASQPQGNVMERAVRV